MSIPAFRIRDSAPEKSERSYVSTPPGSPANRRDWRHLLELRGLVEARVIDLDGAYDPCRPNDWLLPDMAL